MYISIPCRASTEDMSSGTPRSESEDSEDKDLMTDESETFYEVPVDIYSVVMLSMMHGVKFNTGSFYLKGLPTIVACFCLAVQVLVTYNMQQHMERTKFQDMSEARKGPYTKII